MAVKRASAFFALALCAEAALSAPLELKVVGDRVNLRARPVFDAEVAGQVSSGVTLVAPEGIPEGAEWVKVRPPASVDLWIFSALVSDGVVTADDTYVRCGPGQQYKPVGKVGKGFRVEPRGAASGDWLRIAPVPTAELYISSAYVLAVPPADAGATAKVVPSSEFLVPGSQPPTPTTATPTTATPTTATPTTANPPAAEPPTDQLTNSPTDQPSNCPTVQPTTDQLTNCSTDQLTNGQTVQPSNRQTVKLSNCPTVQPATVQPSNRPTVKPSNCPTVQPATAQPSNRPTVQPSNRQTVQPSNESTAVPAVLSGYQLAAGPRQGEVVALRGRLERLSLAKAPGFSRYQLVDKAGSSRSAAICRVVGLQGQWHELVGSEIEVEGRLWTLSDSIPVVDAGRVRRIASWEK